VCYKLSRNNFSVRVSAAGFQPCRKVAQNASFAQSLKPNILGIGWIPPPTTKKLQVTTNKISPATQK
jgi:hypothetical protein